ncbi:MAG: hypothetical protein PGN20_15185 [Agrobacterium cavarae]
MAGDHDRSGEGVRRVMVTLKDLSPAQQRLLNDMKNTPLRKTEKGWIARSPRPHADATRQKLQSLGLFEKAEGHHAYQLTSEAYELAIGVRESAGEA